MISVNRVNVFRAGNGANDSLEHAPDGFNIMVANCSDRTLFSLRRWISNSLEKSPNNAVLDASIPPDIGNVEPLPLNMAHIVAGDSPFMNVLYKGPKYWSILGDKFVLSLNGMNCSMIDPGVRGGKRCVSLSEANGVTNLLRVMASVEFLKRGATDEQKKRQAEHIRKSLAAIRNAKFAKDCHVFTAGNKIRASLCSVASNITEYGFRFSSQDEAIRAYEEFLKKVTA